MKTAAVATQRSATSKVILALSLFTAAYWALVMTVDVYHFAVVGVFYEILWLPMLVAIYSLPVIALVFWIVERFRLKSFYFYSLMALLLAVLIIWLRN